MLPVHHWKSTSTECTQGMTLQTQLHRLQKKIQKKEKKTANVHIGVDGGGGAWHRC